jgi:hypothetical protein
MGKTVQCPACGNNQVLPEGITSGFCTACAASIVATDPSPAPQPNPQDGYTQAPQQPYPQPQPNPQDGYTQAPQQPYPAPPQDAYTQAPQQPYPQPQPNPQDGYTQAPQQPYPAPPQDAYTQAPQQTYPQPQPNPQDAYTQAPQQPYPQPQPYQQDAYQQAPQQPYPAPPPPQDAYAQPPQQSYPQGAYPPAYPSETSPEPTKFKVSIPFLAATTLVVVALIVGAIFFIPMLTASPYQRAETAFFTSMFSSLPIDGGGAEVAMSAKYAPGRAIRDLGVPDISVSGVVSSVEMEALMDMSMKIGDTSIPTILLAVADSDVKVYIPDITKYYLQMTVDTGDSEIDISKLDQKKLATTLNNIGKAYFTAVKGDMKSEKGVTLSGGDVEVKCDKYTIEFTEKTLARFLAEALKEIRANENLVEFISEIYSDGDFKKALEDMEKEIADMEEKIADLDDDDFTTLLRMTVWIKGKDIVARTIDKISGSDVVLSYQYLVQKNDMYINASYKDGRDEYFSLIGDLKKDDGAWGGKVTATFNEYDYWSGGMSEMLSATFTVEGWKKSGDFLIGSISLKGTAADGSGSFVFKAEFDKDGPSQTLTLTGEISAGSEKLDLGSLQFSYSQKSIKKLELPSFDEKFAVDPNDYSSENGQRAKAMADDLYAYYLKHEYDFYSDVLYDLWSMVDDIYYYSR